MPIAKPAAKSVITLKLQSVEADHIEYKPFDPVWTAPDGGQILIEVPIDSSGIVSREENTLTLNLDGFKSMVATLAETVDELEEIHRHNILSKRRTS
jgi:hypothetical protein